MNRAILIGLGLFCTFGCQDDKKPAAGQKNFQGVALNEFSQPSSPALSADAETTTNSQQPAGSMSARGNTNFQSGDGAIQNIRKAGQRTATLSDMQQLGQFMTMMELESNRMPQPATVKEFIRRDAPKLVALLDDGTIILTGTSNRSGLWAYEVDADKFGGIALIAGTPQRLSKEEIQRWLGQ